MHVRNRRIERLHDMVAVCVRDHQRRQEFDRVAAVAGDLDEDVVILEQRDGDELTEQAPARSLDCGPGRLQRQRFRRAELDADQKSFAAHSFEQFVARDHGVEFADKTLALTSRVFGQPLRLHHLERGDAGCHREVVLAKGRAVHHRAIHAVEHFVVDRFAQEHGAHRHMPAG